MARRRKRRRSSGQLGFWGRKKSHRDAVVTVSCTGKGSYSVIGSRSEVEKVASTVDHARCKTKISRL